MRSVYIVEARITVKIISLLNWNASMPNLSPTTTKHAWILF